MMIEISSILLFLAGLILVVVCSDLLVDGASDIARRSGISEFVIGLTIVGIGTSMPEMVVSFLSAIRGNADMAVGNVIGSNIFNTLLILGVTAMILPMTIQEKTLRRDIPINIAASLFLIAVGFSQTLFHIGQDSLSRLAGLVMLGGFAIYLYTSFKYGKEDSVEEEPEESKLYKNAFIPVLMTLGGLVGLIFGGRLFVNGATEIARALGWSDKFIAITILAGGTSLPELATCVVAALKHRGQLALGNIIGSNISNILLILGGSALIHPLSMLNISFIDMGFLIASAIVILISYFTFDKRMLGRIEGLVLLIMESAYMYLLIRDL